MAGTEINKVDAEFRNQCALLAMQALIARGGPSCTTPRQVAELAFRYAAEMTAYALLSEAASPLPMGKFQ